MTKIFRFLDLNQGFWGIIGSKTYLKANHDYYSYTSSIPNSSTPLSSFAHGLKLAGIPKEAVLRQAWSCSFGLTKALDFSKYNDPYVKRELSCKILSRIWSNRGCFVLQKHKWHNKFLREFSKRCAFLVNLLSTFDNLKTGCKPDKHWVLTTCQPICKKSFSMKYKIVIKKNDYVVSF